MASRWDWNELANGTGKPKAPWIGFSSSRQWLDMHCQCSFIADGNENVTTTSEHSLAASYKGKYSPIMLHVELCSSQTYMLKSWSP